MSYQFVTRFITYAEASIRDLLELYAGDVQNSVSEFRRTPLYASMGVGTRAVLMDMFRRFDDYTVRVLYATYIRDPSADLLPLALRSLDHSALTTRRR